MSGLLDGSQPSAHLTKLLEADAETYTWVAAAVGANSAAGYQLASQHPVMAIGGFNGTDPSPTLRQFKQYVADGKIHYFIGGGPDRTSDGPIVPRAGTSGTTTSTSSQISAWVAKTFTAKTIDGVPVYDLSGGVR
jgi:4-amino-4-deoxy-L-arabinose transferase-like glycosyltransferase